MKDNLFKPYFNNKRIIGELSKGVILQIGIIDEFGEPQHWKFDCKNSIPAISIIEGGDILYAGYSIEELKEISNNIQ